MVAELVNISKEEGRVWQKFSYGYYRFQNKNCHLWLWWNNLSWTSSPTENSLKVNVWVVGNNSLDVVHKDCDPYKLGDWDWHIHTTIYKIDN